MGQDQPDQPSHSVEPIGQDRDEVAGANVRQRQVRSRQLNLRIIRITSRIRTNWAAEVDGRVFHRLHPVVVPMLVLQKEPAASQIPGWPLAWPDLFRVPEV